MSKIRIHGVDVEVSRDSRTAVVRDPKSGKLLFETGAVKQGDSVLTAQIAATRWAKANKLGHPLPTFSRVPIADRPTGSDK